MLQLRQLRLRQPRLVLIIGICFAVSFLAGAGGILLARGYSLADIWPWPTQPPGPGPQPPGPPAPPAVKPGQVIWVPRSGIAAPEPPPAIPNPPVTVSQIPPGKWQVALTFDSGWIFEPTHALLDVLREHGLRLTFFPRAKWIEDHPSLIARILAEGHEVGSHSYTHPDLTKVDPERIDSEIRLAKEALVAAGGEDAFLPFYRPPYGAHSPAVSEVLAQYGYGWVVMWQVDSLDWREPGVEAITRRVLERTKDGGIILMHVGSWQTVEALPAIIKGLRDQGFEIVKVSELLGLSFGPPCRDPIEYTVGDDDTLESIAAAHDTTAAELLHLNPTIRR